MHASWELPWMYLWWSLCTSYLHACQMRVTVGDSGLCCCACVAYFEHLFNSLVCWFRTSALGLVLFQIWINEISKLPLKCRMCPQRFTTPAAERRSHCRGWKYWCHPHCWTQDTMSVFLVECCFTSTETVDLLGTGAQDGHLDFHNSSWAHPYSSSSSSCKRVLQTSTCS